MVNTKSPGTQTNDGSTLKRLINVGTALSAEKDHDALMEIILVEAKAIYNADGGTLYLRNDDRLTFAIMRNDSMNIAMGGTSSEAIPFPPLPLHDPDTGQPNHHTVATHVALTGEVVNTVDAYETSKFDFSGAKAFDEKTGYRSTSFLTLPLKNYQHDVVGVLQLINARTGDTGEVITFSPDSQPLVEALASQAAIALDNQLLLVAQKELLVLYPPDRHRHRPEIPLHQRPLPACPRDHRDDGGCRLLRRGWTIPGFQHERGGTLRTDHRGVDA